MQNVSILTFVWKWKNRLLIIPVAALVKGHYQFLLEEELETKIKPTFYPLYLVAYKCLKSLEILIQRMLDGKEEGRAEKVGGKEGEKPWRASLGTSFCVC